MNSGKDEVSHDFLCLKFMDNFSLFDADIFFWS